jgi:hypothetical protein
MKRVRIDATMIEGAVSCEQGENWLKPWRLPVSERRLFPPDEALAPRAEMTAGVRLRVETDSRELGLTFLPRPAVRRFDLTLGGELVQTVVAPEGAGEIRFETLPAGVKCLELWLPQNEQVSLGSLVLDDSATLAAPFDPRKRWVTYGSSITHCGAAHSPARTWPATAARLRDLNLTCLGYGGQCHLDPMMARMIRDLPADFISLKVGINVQGGATLSPRTFRPAIIGLVQVIREKHPAIPIAVISPIISPPREDVDNAVGLSLKKMRVEVADAVARLQDHGDANLHYVDGLELFDESLVDDYLPDLLHPNGDGYEIMGRRFAERVIDTIFLKK